MRLKIPKKKSYKGVAKLLPINSIATFVTLVHLFRTRKRHTRMVFQSKTIVIFSPVLYT